MELTANHITDPNFKIFVQELGRNKLYWAGSSFFVAMFELLSAKYIYKEAVTLEWR